MIFDTTDPRLAETVRRRRFDPAPPITAGRRLWGPAHLLLAAEALGVLTPELGKQLEHKHALQAVPS